eukprot:10515978-Ditylum_brightwellii.AAC.1
MGHPACGCTECLQRAEQKGNALACPPLLAFGCRYAFNIHQHWKVSVLREAEEVVYSKEEVTQGDPMAMF